MPGFLRLDPDPAIRADTDGEEQTGPMAAATRYLFCGHLPDQEDQEDEVEEAKSHRAVHYLDDPDAPYDWDDFFSQKVRVPEPQPDDLGRVTVDRDEDGWRAWWWRGGEQHDIAHGSREAMLAAAHDHIATQYFIRSKGENERPLDWSAEGFPEPDWSAPVTQLGPEDEPEVRALCERELQLDPDAPTLPALLARRAHRGLSIRRGGRLLGVALGSVVEGRNDDHQRRGSLDLFVVAREFRRQGLARRLIERLIKRALAQVRERGHDTAEIGWAGPLPYFSRLLEARIGRVFWQYEKLLDAGTSPSVDGRD